MPEYAWKRGAWKGDLWKYASWGVNPNDSDPPDPGIGTIGGGASGLRFATSDGHGLGGLRKNRTLVSYGKKRKA
jgi:hypothetical protein